LKHGFLIKLEIDRSCFLQETRKNKLLLKVQDVRVISELVFIQYGGIKRIYVMQGLKVIGINMFIMK